MFVTIKTDQNLNLDGQWFGQGTVEVSDDVAERIEAMGLRWIRVTARHPGEVHGNADAGPLTSEAMQYGTEGAKAKKLREIIEEREAAAKIADELANATEPDPAALFACTEPDCEGAFPTVAALERHGEMNHFPEEEPVDPDDPSQGVAVPAEPVVEAPRVRVAGDGLGALRKGESYTKAE